MLLFIRHRRELVPGPGGKTNGLDNYLVINGLARVTEGGAPNY